MLTATTSLAMSRTAGWPDRRTVFLVGVGRSGTSLVQSMLNAHPAICFPPEINFIRRYLATHVLEATCRRSGAAGLLDRLAADPLLGRLGLDREQLGEIVTSLRGRFNSAGFYRELLRRYADVHRGTVEWIGDKDPRSVEFLPVIHRHFPGASVLHVIRDPRDVLASKKNAQWSRDRWAIRHIFANRVQLKMGRRLGRALFGEHYLEFAYEDLIRDPTATLTAVCRHLTLEFSPAMLDFAASSRQLVAASEMAWKKETLGPLLSANSGKWKQALSAWETLLTESACREAFETMHYESSDAGRRGHPARRAAVAAVTALLALLDPVYRTYRARRLG